MWHGFWFQFGQFLHRELTLPGEIQYADYDHLLVDESNGARHITDWASLGQKP